MCTFVLNMAVRRLEDQGSVRGPTARDVELWMGRVTWEVGREAEVLHHQERFVRRCTPGAGQCQEGGHARAYL